MTVIYLEIAEDKNKICIVHLPLSKRQKQNLKEIQKKSGGTLKKKPRAKMSISRNQKMGIQKRGIIFLGGTKHGGHYTN